MKYTPGPWIAKPEVAWSGGTWNIDTEDEKGVACAWPGELGADAATANARLIAEVPALLELLMKLRRYDRDRNLWGINDEIDAAIAKVTGND